MLLAAGVSLLLGLLRGQGKEINVDITTQVRTHIELF